MLPKNVINKAVKNLLLFMMFILYGCNQDTKCVKVVNNKKQNIQNATLVFSAIKKGKAGNLVTNFSPLYSYNIGETNIKGKICFTNHVLEDSMYSYENFRFWTFTFNSIKKSFYSFEEIPIILILE